MQCCKQTRLKHQYQLLHRSCATSHSKLFRNAQQSQKLPSPDLIGYRRIICRVFIITLRRFTFTFSQIEKPNFSLRGKEFDVPFWIFIEASGTQRIAAKMGAAPKFCPTWSQILIGGNLNSVPVNIHNSGKRCLCHWTWLWSASS